MSDTEQTQEMIVTGVVHSYGSWGSYGSELWTLHFDLYAWRDADGNLHRMKLQLHGAVSYEQYHLKDDVKAFSIVRVRVRLTHMFSAEFLELLDYSVETDEELTRIAVRLAEPLTYTHPRFGTFVFDYRFHKWQVAIEWVGEIIELKLPGDEASEPDDAFVQTAIRLWDDQVMWKQRISDYAVQELLPIKNDFWLEEEETPLSSDEFLSRMLLRSIFIDDDDEFDFWHEDGDMFYGHWIRITGDLENGPTRADIPG